MNKMVILNIGFYSKFSFMIIFWIINYSVKINIVNYIIFLKNYILYIKPRVISIKIGKIEIN